MHESMGYPEVTTNLWGWLMDDDCTLNMLVGRLKAIYDYANNHWDVVQSEWIRLFTDSRAGWTGFEGHISQCSGEVVGRTNQTHEGFDKPDANDKIGSTGGIIGVLVDTNFSMSNSTPPPESFGPTSWNRTGNKLALFQPFVFVHTVDAHGLEYCAKEMKKSLTDEVTVAASKAAVTAGGDKAWLALIRMGRPMWWSMFALGNELPEMTDRHDQSGSKYTDAGRPALTTVLALRLVADFMAVLAYRSYESERCLSTYALDPVLRLGAIKVWYALPDGLAMYILPQLKKLIFDEALDTGGVDEMVGRILMLLAMESCARKNKPFSEIVMRGAIVPVLDFLKVLEIDKIAIFRNYLARADNEKTAFKTWKSQRKDWYMGFTHFPETATDENEMKTEDAMKVVEDKVEIAETKVSLMLVQVKTRSTIDFELTKGVTRKLCPRFVFPRHNEIKSESEASERDNDAAEVENQSTENGEEELVENPLSNKTVHEVIRIYMNLQDDVTEGIDCFKFIYSTSLAESELMTTQESDEEAKPTAKRKRSMTEMSEASDDVEMDDAEIHAGTQILANNVKSPRDPMSLIEFDLVRRRAAERAFAGSRPPLSALMSDEELKAIAAYVHPESLTDN
ncbi:unnamed protein product [Phytophthora lilii]|uniref:Unnamed protein product n=1 Tax=Phytophthora lilii TaxID=2077276 RepID=A0A9W6TPZ3_9STRA|nr:unnamed protein product [Phytophthora lilii]